MTCAAVLTVVGFAAVVASGLALRARRDADDARLDYERVASGWWPTRLDPLPRGARVDADDPTIAYSGDAERVVWVWVRRNRGWMRREQGGNS